MLLITNNYSDFVSNVPGIPSSNRGRKSRLGLIVGIAVPVGVVSLILIFAVLYVKRKSQNYNEEGKNITAVVEVLVKYSLRHKL